MASDFEATDARKGFPCFDEPAMKAEYTTTIIHESIHTALSNMPVEVCMFTVHVSLLGRNGE